MKAHLAKVSLALLSTVFLLGCQEQGSEPVGPEGPQFNKPDASGKVRSSTVALGIAMGTTRTTRGAPAPPTPTAATCCSMLQSEL